MKKLIILFLLIVCQNSFGQLPFSTLTESQDMVATTIRNSIFLIKQSYLLQDSINNENFGLNGENEFGHSVSWGIKVKGGYCFFDIAEKPWEYDDGYTQYRGKYVPKKCGTQYVELEDSVTHQIKESHNSKTIFPSKAYYKTDSITFQNKGFVTDFSLGYKKGWIVWLTSEHSLTELSFQDSISYIIYKKEITVDEKRYCEIETPLSERKMLGGFYLIPKQTTIGELTFFLTGLLVPDKDNKWNIIIPSEKTIQKDNNGNTSQNVDNILTPIKKKDSEPKNKRKKQLKKKKN